MRDAFEKGLPRGDDSSYAEVMATPGFARSPLLRSLGFALALVALTALLLGVFQLALALPGSGEAWWVHLLFCAVFWVYVGAGLVAWWRRPGNRMGVLIVFGGFALFTGSLADTGVPLLTAIGTVSATSVLAVVIHLLLAFPSGRRRDAASRTIVVAGYVVALVLQAPLYLFDSAAPWSSSTVRISPRSEPRRSASADSWSCSPPLRCS